jgi:hypothetical protein
MGIRTMSRALFAGLVVQPALRARDRVVVRAFPFEIANAWRTLWRLDRDLPPHTPSFEAVRRGQGTGLSAEALTWGETPLATAIKLLKDAGVTSSSTVVDLGAGRGMVLLAARALGARARGVELDARRVGPAQGALQAVGAELVVGDAREANVDDATHVWLSWTCMPAELREELASKLDRPGLVVIAMTWELPPAFAVVQRARAWFPWGPTDVVIAQRS